MSGGWGWGLRGCSVDQKGQGGHCLHVGIVGRDQQWSSKPSTARPQGPQSPGQGRRLGPVGWVRPHHHRSKSLTSAFKSSAPPPPNPVLSGHSWLPVSAHQPGVTPPLQAEVGTHTARPSGAVKAFLGGGALGCCCHSNRGSWALRSEVTSHPFPTQGSAAPGSEVQGSSD